jgi:hypothetical protein
MLKFNLRTTFAALVMTVSVAACGGGGGGGEGSDVAAPSSPTSPSLLSDIPASALASVDGLIAFMNQLIDTGTNDTSEPILLGESVLPVSDTI